MTGPALSTRRAAALLLIGGALAAGAMAPTSQPASDKPAAAGDAQAALTLNAAAFMAGQWQSDGPQGVTEEHWSNPAGNNIMGMFRWLRPDGSPMIFEILAITQEADGVYLRLRHFSSKLVAKEEKDAPMTLKLAEASPGKAVFRAVPAEKALAAVTYHSPEPDRLHILVEFPDPASKPLEFNLTRQTVSGK